jgi:hypothetical protein
MKGAKHSYSMKVTNLCTHLLCTAYSVEGEMNYFEMLRFECNEGFRRVASVVIIFATEMERVTFKVRAG